MASDILIVDDEADIREMVAGILQDDGHRTRLARDSDEDFIQKPIAGVASGLGPEPQDYATGNRIGPYRLTRLVGRGGMGTVYRATDPRLGRTVALKLLKGDDPELWRRFLVKARAQARIEHEHVCRGYEAGQADGEPYITDFGLARTSGLPISA